jgi:hypothetical protein
MTANWRSPPASSPPSSASTPSHWPLQLSDTLRLSISLTDADIDQKRKQIDADLECKKQFEDELAVALKESGQDSIKKADDGAQAATEDVAMDDLKEDIKPATFAVEEVKDDSKPLVKLEADDNDLKPLVKTEIKSE